jgi:pimeloyl-ACP methyl ester carboxylesterase
MAQFHDWREEYPFTSQMLDIGGMRLHYIDEGPQQTSEENGGETVLCVHGNPTWSFYYRSLVQGLSDCRRVVAVDHLGCGMSDKPRQADYCLRAHADRLSTLIAELDLQQITLVVHDWGGPIGITAALEAPERIARLVILNSGLFPPPYVPLRIRMLKTPGLGAWAMERLNAFAGPAAYMAVSGKRGPLAPVARTGLAAPYLRAADRHAIRRFVDDIPLSPRHGTWQELEAVEAGLGTFADRPVLLAWGMRDWCFRQECLDRIAGHFPNAVIRRIADAGHYILEDAPQEVLQAVQAFVAK